MTTPSLTAHLPVTGQTVVQTLNNAANLHGLPASILSDNALIYTARFAGGKGGRTNSRRSARAATSTRNAHGPITPRPAAKSNASNRPSRNGSPHNLIGQLQALLDEFVDYYNHQRPHRSNQRRTPAHAYTALPKDTPTADPDPHYRVRHDRVDSTGRVSLRRAGHMHHIGLGRRHTGTKVVLIIEDLDIRVINTQTGELIRHLKLNPERDYQPQTTTRPDPTT